MKKYIPVLFIVLISIALIFYKFARIPLYLAFDEVEFAQLATALDGKPYTPFTAFADGHTTLYFYIILGFFKLLGTTNEALRLPAAIFSVLNVFVFYKLMGLVFRSTSPLLDKLPKVFNRPFHAYLPFLLTFMFATLRWNINFSRFAFEMPFLLFLELVSIYFLFRYFQRRRMWDLVTSGVFSGLAFNSYQPGRFFFILVLAGLFLKDIFDKQRIVIIKSFLIFLIPFLIIIAPMSIYLVTHPKLDVRVNLQLYFKNSELSLQEKLQFFGENVAKTALMFNVRGDGNGRHNYPFKPALNPIVGLLFLVGIAVAVKNYRDFNKQFFMLYLMLSLGPTILTYPWENPNMLRTFTVIPTIIYFSGLALIQVYRLLTKKLSGTFALCAICALVLFSAFYDIRTYFKYQAPVFRHAFEVRTPLPQAMDYIERPGYKRK